ncbi:MAG: 4-hydroxy-3-methylbut-2-enyl diphosphate reductase [Tepidisphaeraceae bacterium]|jgi:4-hydroxy-3-methylbut-2-enyl diphosphate reductase
MLKILLANPRGFCAGVNMAIECVDRVLELRGPPVYVFHEIVHNKHVVEDFQRRGVVFVDDVAAVPEGGVVVYSAHGIAPEIRRQSKARRLLEIDATCPLVTKVHFEVIRFGKEGYTVIFVGHRNHDEAVGTVGEAPGSIIVVEKPDDVAGLRVSNQEKIAYVTQTTLSVSDCALTVAALKARWPHIKGPARNDICYATTNRQAAVSTWSPEVDVVLVVGSRNSSNSRRLVETATAAGKPAYLIDDEHELHPAWFAGIGSVLVTAGASAPEYLVDNLIRRLRDQFGGEVHQRELVEEDVSFELPRSLRSLAVIGHGDGR